MAKPKFDANQVENMSYDNSSSGLTATDGKGAIDELQASKLDKSGATDLTTSFNIANISNINNINISESSPNIKIEAGDSINSKSTIIITPGLIEVSFDNGAPEYYIRQGGISQDEDVLNRKDGDARYVQSDESVINNGVRITNMVAAPLSDIEALETKPEGTMYIPLDSKSYEYVQIACSDMTTQLTTGTAKAYAPVYFNGILEEVFVHMYSAGNSGFLTVDINKNGSSILSTKLTTDVGEGSSLTATTPAVISDNTVNIGDRFMIDFDTVPTISSGAIVTLKIQKT